MTNKQLLDALVDAVQDHDKQTGMHGRSDPQLEKAYRKARKAVLDRMTKVGEK